jgi:hypothetical protein
MIKDGTNNNKISEFGFGTVQITSAYVDEIGMLALNTAEEHIIGESRSIVKSTEELIADLPNSEILLHFENTKSVEVLIIKLQEVRAMMLGCDLTQYEEWKRHNNVLGVYQANTKIDRLSPTNGGQDEVK